MTKQRGEPPSSLGLGHWSFLGHWWVIGGSFVIAKPVGHSSFAMSAQHLKTASKVREAVVERHGGEADHVWLAPVADDPALQQSRERLPSVALHTHRELTPAPRRVRGCEEFDPVR